MLSQFFLGQELLGKDTAMSRLNSQIAELTELLQLERSGADDLQSQIATLTATLATAEGERNQLAAQLAGFGTGDNGKDAQISPSSRPSLPQRSTFPTKRRRRWPCSTSSSRAAHADRRA
jgi:hypothetical protein